MKGVYVAFLVKSAGHPGLVGDDECEIAGLIDKPYRIARTIDPDEFVDLEQIVGVDIQNAVTIEENSRA